jgi:hypothetical protein
MAIIDPTTNLGKLRLRCGDIGDLPFLPDEVYLQAFADTQTISLPNGSLPRAAKTCAVYILGMLSFRTHEKLGQVEVWGNEATKSYKDFLLLTVANPNFIEYSPVPYAGGLDTVNPLMQFTSDWNACYSTGTASQQIAVLAQMPYSVV